MGDGICLEITCVDLEYLKQEIQVHTQGLKIRFKLDINVQNSLVTIWKIPEYLLCTSNF